MGKDAKNNEDYLGSGIILEKAIKKYGKESFKKEILQHCKTLEELNKQEVYWIKKLKSTDKKIGYNISLGGDGGNIFDQLSLYKQRIVRRKISENSKETRNSEGFKRNKSEKAKEMWKRSGFREKVSASLKGRDIVWKDKIKKSIKKHWSTRSRIVSDETKRKLSEASSGKIIKPIPQNIQSIIVDLYKTIGAKRISKLTKISPYRIISLLKQLNIYEKWKKGIGNGKKLYESRMESDEGQKGFVEENC